MPQRITHAVLARWIGMLAVVGFAQLFRSPVEQIIAPIFLIAAVLLLVSRVTDLAVWSALGFTTAMLAFATRSLSAFLGSSNSWTGQVIVITVWAFLASLAFERSRQAKRLVDSA